MSEYHADSGRNAQIHAYIEREKRVTVGQVADHFNISAATVRRAIGALADRGVIARFHGGAFALLPSPRELPALLRGRDQYEEKARIGRLAAGMVEDGETVFLGSGTTTLQVAHHLADRRNLTVVTNSLLVITALEPVEGVTVVALGGMLRRSELSFIGHLVEQGLQEMRTTRVIMGIRAIHADMGLMNDYLPETLTDRAILKMGGEVIVLADHTKCNRVAPSFVAPVSTIGTLVTDRDAPRDFVHALESRNVTVRLA